MNRFLKLKLSVNILGLYSALLALLVIEGQVLSTPLNLAGVNNRYQNKYLRYNNSYLADFWLNYFNKLKIPTISSPIITKFINKKIKHDPNNLPSSYRLFYRQKPQGLVWSILIPTLVERSQQFEKVFTKLLGQIMQANLQDQIEIVFYRDNRDAIVGYKRNQLIRNASGKYTCFVDDDDEVSANYITLIYDALLQDQDCVKLIGIFSANNFKKPFIHSILYNSYFETNQAYYRPPNHLNPIKRAITNNFTFQNDLNYGEDTDWAMQICRANAIKTEAYIDEPYYFYNFVMQKSACQP